MTISAIERMGVAPPLVPESEPLFTVGALPVSIQELRYTIKEEFLSGNCIRERLMRTEIKWGQIYLFFRMRPHKYIGPGTFSGTFSDYSAPGPDLRDALTAAGVNLHLAT
jgi:hypothetical protein